MVIKGVTFNNIPNKKLGTKIGTMLTQSNISISKDVETYIQSEDFYKLISVLDIDWAGIEIDANTTINDTADLINWIKSISVNGGTGEIGLKGPQGDKGPEGDQGEPGIQGAKGEAGDKGETGDQGPAGIQGTKGVQGPQGIIGEQGIAGPQGIVGDQGAKGIIGDKGIQGDKGIVGAQGIQGSKGLSGDQGLIGEQGAKGDQGDQGIQGAKGEAGDKGETGDKGEAGDQGEPGIQGAKGEVGDKGETGDKGEDGDKGIQGDQGPQGVAGTFETSILDNYASKTYVGEKIAEVVGAAPETLDTLKEIADKLGDNDTALGSLNTALESKANSSDVYTKIEIDQIISEVETIKGDKGDQGETGVQGAKGDQGETGVQGAKGDQGETGVQGAKGDQGETGVQGAKGDQGEAGAQGAKGDQGEAGVQGAKGDQGEAGVQGAKGDQGETGVQGAKGDQGETGTFDSSDLEDYATKEYVSQEIEKVVGAASENFDTLKEISDVMGDLKVIDVEGVEPVEGVHYTQEEIDAAQEGDEAYGKTVNDWKVEPIEAVEEQSHNMTIKEFVENSMQSVDEKEAVAKVQAKYDALLTLLNVRASQVNSIIINQELETNSNVTFDEPVENVIIPETTAAYTVSAPLEDDSTVTLSSNKYMTLFNTNEEAVDVTVQRPAEQSETGTSGTTVYLVGEYDTLTLENVSPNVKSGQDPAKVNNVVISQDNTKNLTLTLDIQDGATITNNSNTNITITDKNNEETVLTVVAPNSTVTLNGSTYTTLNAEVSDNTLIIKKTAHIGTLNVTKGNVKVEVARQSDIANVIDNLNIAEGYSVDYLHDEITSANISKLNTTGTHILQEDIAKSGNFSVGLFSSDDIVWDLNGHNLTSSNTRGYGIFILRGSAQLEINDTVGTGVVKNTTDDYGFWTSTVDSKVVINGGNFEASTHVLYAQKGTIEVNGGSFKLTNAATADKDQNGNFKFLLNCHDADYVSGEAKIIVRGGKFYGFDPSNTYGEPGGPVSFVAEGYESVPTNEAYEYGTVYEVRQQQGGNASIEDWGSDETIDPIEIEG